jgi:hypothetical protein
MRAATVLSSWCEFPSAIPGSEIISTFKDKSKRPKGSGKIVLESDGDLNLTIDNWTLVCDVMLWLGNRAVFVHKLWVLMSTCGIRICAELLVSCGYLTCGSESLVRTNS